MLETVITTSDFMVKKKKKKKLKGCTIFNLSEAGSSFLRGVGSRGRCHTKNEDIGLSIETKDQIKHTSVTAV